MQSLHNSNSNSNSACVRMQLHGVKFVGSSCPSCDNVGCIIGPITFSRRCVAYYFMLRYPAEKYDLFAVAASQVSPLRCSSTSQTKQTRNGATTGTATTAATQ
jgi:hypothetical protein